MYDLVLLHPGGENMKGLQGPFFPIGWLGITSFLKKHGYNVKIVNCFLERHLNPSTSIETLLARHPSLVYGIDLHWFIHSFEAIVLAKKVKGYQPKSKVILGGFTATFFAKSILKEYKFIDCIIRGESELPLLRYLEEIKRKLANLRSVPNLSYRHKLRILHNPIKYVASRQDIDELDFLDFSCVLNHEQMFFLNNADYKINATDSEDPKRYFVNKSSLANWPVYTGRGCNYNCSFCGGSNSAFREVCSRNCLTLRSPEYIANDVLKLTNEMNVDSIYFPHSPLTTPCSFHKAILDHIRKHTPRLKCGFFFEDVPFIIDIDIIKEYLSIFNPYASVIRVYVVDYDVDIRTQNNFNISWDKVVELHEFCKDSPVMLQVAVLIGLPGQNQATCKKLAKELQKLEACHYFPLIYTAEMHPGSLLHKNPLSFGISQEVVTFNDFYSHLCGRTNKNMFLGYSANSDCSVQEQKSIIEKMLHYNTKVIYLDSRPEHETHKKYDIVSSRFQRINNKCNKINEYAKMILEAHAVGANKVVIYIKERFRSSDISYLLYLCKHLDLAATLCVDAIAIGKFCFKQQRSDKSNIILEMIIRGNRTGTSEKLKEKDVFIQIQKGFQSLLSLGYKVNGHALISSNSDDWYTLLKLLKLLGVDEPGVIVDDREITPSINLQQINDQLSTYKNELGINVPITYMSKVIS